MKPGIRYFFRRIFMVMVFLLPLLWNSFALAKVNLVHKELIGNEFVRPGKFHLTGRKFVTSGRVHKEIVSITNEGPGKAVIKAIELIGLSDPYRLSGIPEQFPLDIEEGFTLNLEIGLKLDKEGAYGGRIRVHYLDENGEQSETVSVFKQIVEVCEPFFLYEANHNAGSLVITPEGTIKHFYDEDPSITPPTVYADVSHDGGASWEFKVHQKGAAWMARDPGSGELVAIYRRDGQTRMITTLNAGRSWNEEISVPFPWRFESGVTWLRNGRMVVAAKLEDITLAVYHSNDGGANWGGPSKKIESPPYPGRWYNSASSPQLVELRDGRIWMLTRNSQDHLWEYFSSDGGETWTCGSDSRFYGVTTNLRLARIPDGRLLLVWLNTIPLPPELARGSSVNSNRDVLHAAISDDDGKTWRGFREIMLDRRRHDCDYRGAVGLADYGLNQPKFVVTGEDKVVVASGQTSGHRQMIIFDIDWLSETERSTDFSEGYSGLSVWKFMRERDWKFFRRKIGACLIQHPSRKGKNVLELRRENDPQVIPEQQQDGACWNFPAGLKGALKVRLMLRKGFKSGAISMTDRFYNPSDNTGDRTAMFKLDIPADGMINTATCLEPERWYTIKLEWNGTGDKKKHCCKVYIDGALQANELPLLNTSPNGLSYVRFRSTAEEEDLAGFLVEHIKANVVW